MWMCFARDVASEAPRNAIQNVSRVTRPRSPPMSMNTDAFCSQFSRFDDQATPACAHEPRPR